MIQNKLVSVCINAYNAEKYIAETLESVINQTYKNLQIIVVDDASTDATAEIVKGFDDPRIELYTLSQNGHISNANNETYHKVRGEYMVHIDSDDIMLPDLIQKSVDYLESHPECGATFCRPIIIDENGVAVIDEDLENTFNVSAKTQAEFVRLFFDSSNHLLHPGSAMRKSVIDDIGFHDLSLCYSHDFDYWTRLILKYPIHIFDEALIRYRMDSQGGHNSYMDSSKRIAYNTEYARVIYRMIENCPKDMFLEAFSDRLRLKGPHTHEDIELEKAFLLQDGLSVLPKNKFLSIVKLAELFQDKKYVELARDKFNFTIRDFYKLQSSEILYNQEKFDAQQHEFYLQLIERNKKIDDLCSEITKLNQVIVQKDVDFANLVALSNTRQTEIERLNLALQHNQSVINQLIEKQNEKFYSKNLRMLRRIKHFCLLRDKNGKKYRKSVMLYGFFGMNLGDDLFFEKLIKRYQDTMFLVYCFGHYRPFFEQFDNVKFYAYEDAFVQKVNRIGNKLKIHDLFELLLLKRSSATVHIGGSIYQQICDYELDYKLRIRRKQPFKPFYSISCNFGAYKTEQYRLQWRKQFVKFKDICFRDRYSYELFSDLKCVRYAPDLLFSYKHTKPINIVEGSVAISVFNPFATFRSIPSKIGEEYRNVIAKTICDLIKDQKAVTILSFCSLEGDLDFTESLLDQLPCEIRDRVQVASYSFDTKDQILDTLAQAEYIIGTRLHSVILGLVMGKKVLPIAYNSKISYILDDIGYNQPVIELEKIEDYKEIGFFNLLKEIKPFDVSAYTDSDALQFKRMDKFFK